MGKFFKEQAYLLSACRQIPGFLNGFKLLLCAALMLTAAANFAQDSDPSSEQAPAETPEDGKARPVLKSIPEIFELDQSAARSGWPVEVEGVITMLDSTLWVSFIHDDEGNGIYIYFLSSSEFKEGMKVRVEGKTDVGFYSPYVLSENVTLLEEEAEVPPFREARIHEINHGFHDSSFVRVKGVVRNVSNYLGWLFIEIDDFGEHIQVVTKYSLTDGEVDLGALIEASGIIGLNLNTSEDFEERTGFQVLAQSGFCGVKVLEPGPEDLFSVPIRPIEKLRFYDARVATGQPIQVEGTVAWSFKNKTLWVVNERHGIPVFLNETFESGFAPGDKVRVAGFGHDIDGRVHLENAKVKKLDSGPDDDPVIYNRVQFPIERSGQLHGSPQEIVGELISRTFWSEDEVLLTMQHNEHRFWVWMSRSKATLPEVWRNQMNWLVGSQLSVKGVLLTRPVPVEYSFEWPAQLKRSESLFSLNLLTQGPDLIEVISLPEKASETDLIVQKQTTNEDSIEQRPQGTIALSPSTIGAISAGSALAAGLALFFVCHYQSRLQKEISIRGAEKIDLETRDILLNMAGDWLLALAEDGRIIRMNQASKATLEINEEALEKDTYLENFLTKESISEFRGIFFEIKRPTSQPRPTQFVELEFLPCGDNNSESVFIEISFIPVFEEDKIKYFLAYGKDITRLHDLTVSLRKNEESLRSSYESQERIARDLHDGIVQSIFAIGLSLETCKVQAGKGFDTTQLEHSLGSISEDINRVIREIRGFISEIESGPLSGAELKPAIKSLILTLESFEELNFYLDIEPEASRALTSREVTQLIFIIREGVSNAIRHAEAEKVTISLRRRQSSIILEIQDDGKGFNNDLPGDGAGHGLRNMRSRAREINAEFDIHTRSGKGTTVSVRLRKHPSEKVI